MTAAIDRRDVSTTLHYWDRVPGNAITIDFTKPGTQEEYYELIQKSVIAVPSVIRDVRGREAEFSLDVNGFQYVRHEVPELQQCGSEEEIAKVLLPTTENLVKELLGASKVITFVHRIRSRARDENKLAENKAPALNVHSDFTSAGALRNLEKVVPDANERNSLLKGRCCIVNVWRPLKTITRDPLAVCDWQSVNVHRGWIKQRLVFPSGWSEHSGVVYSEEQKWYYLNQQEPSEPLVFKRFDSNAMEDGGQTVAHSAFVDPAYQDGPARESIEIKMFVFI